MLGITPQSVKIWNRHGLLRGHAYGTTRTTGLYEPSGREPAAKSTRHETVRTGRFQRTSCTVPGGAV